MHKNKINRARMLAKCGAWPVTFEENLARVPDSVVINCPARILADVVDALYEQFQRGEEHMATLSQAERMTKGVKNG